MSMEWLAAAGFIPSETEANEEAAHILATRFELFFTLGSAPSFTELNRMTMTELRAVAIAKEKLDGRYAELVKARQVEQKALVACQNAIERAAARLQKTGA